MKHPVHIFVRGLTHVYSSGYQSLTALKGVDLEVDRGVFVSIIGFSGGGKTTLLKVIGGLLEPTTGIIQVDGVSSIEAQRRKVIGFVFQDPSLLPWRTVFENMILPLQLNSGQGQIDMTEAERLLEAIGLVDFRGHHPHQLSGGMRQRIAFARALVMNPSVLLMDEPLSALDDITRVEMRYELLRLWEGSSRTVVLVTHSISEAIMMSDRVLVLSSRPGRVLQQVDIDLPRPREETLERSDRFLNYVSQIRNILLLDTSRGRSIV